MGDRILYASYENTAVPEASSGHTGFPFGVVYGGTPAQPGYYPLALPLEAANSSALSCSKLYNRGKILRLDTDLSVTVNAVTTSATSADLIDVLGTSRELDLFSPDPADCYKHFQQSSTFVQIDVTFFLPTSGLDFKLWKDGSDFKPHININGTITAVDGSDTIVINFDSNVGSGFPDSIVGSLEGESITIYYEVAISGGGTTDFTFSQFDLSFSEYWEYAARDASPIYNSSTGLELQNRRN